MAIPPQRKTLVSQPSFFRGKLSVTLWSFAKKWWFLKTVFSCWEWLFCSGCVNIYLNDISNPAKVTRAFILQGNNIHYCIHPSLTHSPGDLFGVLKKWPFQRLHWWPPAIRDIYQAEPTIYPEKPIRIKGANHPKSHPIEIRNIIWSKKASFIHLHFWLSKGLIF